MTSPLQPILYTGLLDQARIRVLLVPVAPRPTTLSPPSGYLVFQNYARQLAKHSSARLVDLENTMIGAPPTANGISGRWCEGKLRFNYVTDAPRDYDYLDEFQPYRQVLAVGSSISY
jgi:hypothetical protein